MLAVTVCFIALATAFDLKTDRIPNALNLTGLTAGLLMAYERAGPAGLLIAVKGVIVMFLASFALFILKAMRGGDGKMLCAVVAMVGSVKGIRILLYALMIASVMGLPRWFKRKPGDRTGIHCSIPIALATGIYLSIYGGGL